MSSACPKVADAVIEAHNFVGRCSLRSPDYPENLPASFGEIIVPSLPSSVKSCPRRKSLLRELLTAAGSPQEGSYQGWKNGLNICI